MATIDEIKRAAVEQTGLDDFGDDSFEEGLTLLLSSLGEEARLNAHGEDFIYGRITGYLGQRLQVEEWYRRHPEIDDTNPFAGHRARITAHRVDGAVDAARPRSRSAISTTVGIVAAVPPAVHRAGRRPAHPTRQGRDARHSLPRAGRHPRTDGMPRADGPGLQVTHLPVVRADTQLLGVAGR